MSGRAPSKDPTGTPTKMWTTDPVSGERAQVDERTCAACGTGLGGLPFCPRDGRLVDGPFAIGERYNAEEALGSGGSALVFGGRHLILGKSVAVKILRRDLAADADASQRFLREARIASQLHHENIVGVVDFGRDERLGAPYLVMERLRGPTLASVIHRDGLLGWPRTVVILQQLARALAAAHADGVMHRDLTPRNIVLESSSGREDFVKLCDFGLSRLAAGDDRITITGHMVGTPAYVAPEQVRGDTDQDGRVDLYALGVIGYEMLTGQLPHQASTAIALLAAKLRDAPIPLRTRDPALDCPDELVALLMRSLATDPEDRPRTAAEVEHALVAIASAAANGAAAKSTPIVGSRVGSYEVKELVATGGVGSVFRAVHPVLGTEVAIKVLLPEHATSPEVVDRFVQEARASTAIGSRHIPRYFDFGQLPDGRAYAIMEYFPGDTLDGRLRKSGPLGEAEALAITDQVAAGVADAHAAGIIHRDLKPENLLLATDRAGAMVVKVLDFGIAKMLLPGGALRKTQIGFFMGTPAYCAPEQVTGGIVDLGADIYALGATLFEMLTGRPPFDGDVQDVFRAKIDSDAPAVSSLRPGVSPELDKAVAQMLARSPEDRFANMSEVRAALAQCAATQITSLVPPIEPVEEDPRAWRRRLGGVRGLVAVGAATVALTAAAIAGSGPDRARGTPARKPATSTAASEPRVPQAPVRAEPPIAPPASTSIPLGVEPPVEPAPRASAPSPRTERVAQPAASRAQPPTSARPPNRAALGRTANDTAGRHDTPTRANASPRPPSTPTSQRPPRANRVGNVIVADPFQ